jgi:hypothetical protein
MEPSTRLRALGLLGFSFVISLTAACGGAAQEAKAPTTDAAAVLADGSGAQDKSTLITPTASDVPPPKTSAVSSKDDGSDIVPPFTAGATKEAAKEPAKKAGKPKKGASAKPKKKG